MTQIGNDVVYCDVIMINGIAMHIYHALHNDVAMSLFYYVLLRPIMILLLSQ